MPLYQEPPHAGRRNGSSRWQILTIKRFSHILSLVGLSPTIQSGGGTVTPVVKLILGHPCERIEPILHKLPVNEEQSQKM